MNLSWRSPTYIYIGLSLIIIFLGYAFFNLWMTILLSFMIAYLLRPIQTTMHKYKINKSFSSFLVLCIFIFIICILGLLFTSLISHGVNKLVERYPLILAQLQQKLEPILAYLGIDLKQGNLINILKQQIPTQAQNIANILLISFKQSGNIIAGIITNLILLPVITFYFLLDWEKLRLKSSVLIPKQPRSKINHFISRVNVLMSAYTKGQISLMFFLSLFYAISLNILGIEKATAIGLFTGCAVLIPYVGFAFGFSLALIIGVLQYGFTAHILFIVLIYSIGQLLESFILTPRLVGESIGLHPLTVIISLIVFGQLLGFIGMLFALPIAAILQIIIKEGYRYYRNMSYN